VRVQPVFACAAKYNVWCVVGALKAAGKCVHDTHA
jgi:hypothetical protein